MGILNLLKNIFKEAEEKEPKRIKVNLSEIKPILDKNKEKIQEREDSIISLIKTNIDSFSKDIQEKVEIVEKVDIESKEKNNKIKAIVYEGRKKYIEFIERLMDNLEEHKNIDNFQEIIENINYSFSKFNESSMKSYERATVLIGKEMGAIKESLKKFSKEILEIYNENKNIISEKKSILFSESKLNENLEIQDKLNKIDEESNELKTKIKEKENILNEKLTILNKIKNSEEYIKNIQLKESIIIKEEEIKNQISQLRQDIDFKSLSSFFHIFPEKMNYIKRYKESFLLEFKEDRGKSLVNLLNEAGLNNDKISEQIKNISMKEEILEKQKKEIKEDPTNLVSSEIETLKENIKNWNDELDWIEKRTEKLKEDEKRNTQKIKEEFKKINIDIEEKDNFKQI
ncbi:hypothetical protein KBC25_01035 [Candidatus Pacearchaeota archaeon]|jgi:hypothetical protein|nr:hypothetical protein [Candidatus Pacearchaeota archaeon]